MPIFKLTRDSLEALPETAFHAQGVRERADLQRLLRANIAAVASDVLVIAEEFGEWDESRRRIDLLAVDRLANLVVIELKRDDDGGHMELQAIRYAAMVSSMTFARAVEVFQGFMDRGGGSHDARAQLLEFLGWDEPKEDDFARDVRIILVAADFSKELTTAVLWLNERDLDIRCVRLKPYANGDQTIVDAQQVVPLPEAEEYTIQIKQKGQAVRAESGDRHETRLAFWKQMVPLASAATPRFRRQAPTDKYWIAASAGVPGVQFSYVIWQEEAGVELYIDRGNDTWNKAFFDYLHERRLEIDAAHGAPLEWQRLDKKRACRILDDSISGGSRALRDQWSDIQSKMIDAMKRLDAALLPHLQSAMSHADTQSV